MKKLIAIGIAAASLLSETGLTAAEWLRGTVIAKIIGPSEPTAETVLSNCTNIFWTTIEIKETRRFFDPELVGTKLRILTTAFASNFVGRTLPLEIIRTPVNSTNEFEKLERYRFQCGELLSGYGTGKFDEETAHGVVLAKIVSPLVHDSYKPPPAENKVAYSQWIEVELWESRDGSVFESSSLLSEWVEIQVIEAKDGVAEEMKGQTIYLRSLFLPKDVEWIGKTIPIEIYKSKSGNPATGYSTRGNDLRTAAIQGKMIEEERQRAAAAKQK